MKKFSCKCKYFLNVKSIRTTASLHKTHKSNKEDKLACIFLWVGAIWLYRHKQHRAVNTGWIQPEPWPSKAACGKGIKCFTVSVKRRWGSRCFLSFIETWLWEIQQAESRQRRERGEQNQFPVAGTGHTLVLWNNLFCTLHWFHKTLNSQ